jgi:hypothetical protein
MFLCKKLSKRTRRPQHANNGVCFGGGGYMLGTTASKPSPYDFTIYTSMQAMTAHVGQQLGYDDITYCYPYLHFYSHLGHRLGTIASKSSLLSLHADDTSNPGYRFDYRLGTTASKPSLSLLSLHADNTPHPGHMLSIRELPTKEHGQTIRLCLRRFPPTTLGTSPDGAGAN